MLDTHEANPVTQLVASIKDVYLGFDIHAAFLGYSAAPNVQTHFLIAT